MLCKLLPARPCLELALVLQRQQDAGSRGIPLVIGFHRHLGNLQSQWNFQVFFLPSCGSTDILQRADLVKFCLITDCRGMLGPKPTVPWALFWMELLLIPGVYPSGACTQRCDMNNMDPPPRICNLAYTAANCNCFLLESKQRCLLCFLWEKCKRNFFWILLFGWLYILDMFLKSKGVLSTINVKIKKTLTLITT